MARASKQRNHFHNHIEVLALPKFKFQVIMNELLRRQNND